MDNNNHKRVLGPRQKALEINLNQNIYGTFAEIGAGQEVARHFFQAGGAAGTIAKSISAYDMIMSDAIYGKSQKGRYVCQERLETMLETEYRILTERLKEARSSETQYFVFADTVLAKSFRGGNENHGWVGLTFIHEAHAAPSTVILHVKMHDAENVQQQEALGLIGVNLIHAAFFERADREIFVSSLMDGLTPARLQIDMIKVMGPGFHGEDSRLYCLELVKNNLCEAVIFEANGEVLQASEVLYKKNLLVIRGGYRPPTNLSLDMIECGLRKFKSSLPLSERDDILVVPEISMTMLLDRGRVNNEDFLARVDLLSALGQKVLISNSNSYADLKSFLFNYGKKYISFVMGSYNVEELFNLDKHSDDELGLLTNFGKLFEPKTKIYIYPAFFDDSDKIKTLDNLNVRPELLSLMNYLKANRYIEDISDYNPEMVKIWSRVVLKMIQDGVPGWEKMVPPSVAKTVKNKCLFGAKCDL